MTSDQDSSFSSTGTDTGLSIPLSQYAKKSVGKVKQRYLEKISTIGIDPVLIELRHCELDPLPRSESTDFLCIL